MHSEPLPLQSARYHARVERILELMDSTLERGRTLERAYERFLGAHALTPGCGEAALRAEPGPEARRGLNGRLLELQRLAYDHLLPSAPARASTSGAAAGLAATAPRALSSRSRI
ncbi:MAG TPA: hypothetical protein PKX00_06665 [Opitutaceae bacterium]|jgi:hypothetical protein|nr:hypothetical protein [Opitutaceae bacterium]HRE05272.1 hypothetical protein [Opitutaceae bacterium]